MVAMPHLTCKYRFETKRVARGMKCFGPGSMPTLLVAAMLAAASPAGAQTALTRNQVQHLLRRFAFSAPPAAVTATLAAGIAPWLAAQENWTALDDSNTGLETLPTALVGGGYPDGNIFERAVMQHMLLTPRQLQAKMELHWLDHFAVGLEKVGDPAIMYHYDQTVRANALGNFETLLTAVAQEPAMLVWLDNNNNAGPVANENFARECMQLYTMGLYQLNDDGTKLLGADGQPIANYTQPEVQEIAKAITGYSIAVDYSNNNPQTRFSVQYNASRHYTGTLRFFGRKRDIPNDATALAAVMHVIATQPAVAPFMATELLQRFVTEHPSPTYVSNIATVWRATESKPDQIAQVITAIVNDPEFLTSYHDMGKQPAELVLDTLRALPGAMQSTSNTTPGSSLLWELSNLNQQLFYSPSVFSFYRPGALNTLTNTGSVLTRTSVFANITNADPANSYTDTYIDIPALRAAMGVKHASGIATYLLDALLDGGTPAQQTLIQDFLGYTPSDNQVRGAIWLILNSPDFAVN